MTENAGCAQAVRRRAASNQISVPMPSGRKGEDGIDVVPHDKLRNDFLAAKDFPIRPWTRKRVPNRRQRGGWVRRASGWLSPGNSTNFLFNPGDGVPLITAYTGLMTPTVRLFAAVGGVKMRPEDPLRSGFFCACAVARMVFCKRRTFLWSISSPLQPYGSGWP
jgi:hypothetical protein